MTGRQFYDEEKNKIFLCHYSAMATPKIFPQVAKEIEENKWFNLSRVILTPNLTPSIILDQFVDYIPLDVSCSHQSS